MRILRGFARPSAPTLALALTSLLLSFPACQTERYFGEDGGVAGDSAGTDASGGRMAGAPDSGGRSGAAGDRGIGGSKSGEEAGGSFSAGGRDASGGRDGAGGVATGGTSGAPGAASGGANVDGAGGDASSVDPEVCERDEQCPGSGVCRHSFRDEDGDGYGKSTSSTGRCDGSVPAGFSPVDGDCCDNGENLELAAKIYPGQPDYFAQPANVCGIDWDYDCSDEVDFGGFVCSKNNDDDCLDPANQNFDSPLAKSSERTLGCANSGALCTDACKTEEGSLTTADCGSSYPLVDCSCGALSCSMVGGTSRRVVHCH